MSSDTAPMVIIRPVSDADALSLQRIESEAFASEEHALAERLADSHADSQRQSRGPWFVPTYVDVAVVTTETTSTGDAIAGYLAWSYEPFGACEKCIHVMNLAVAADFRRLGIATRLLRHVQELSWEKFPQAICMRLIVRADNTPAQKLYMQFGFQKTDDHPKYYNKDIDGIELQLDLDGPASFRTKSRASRTSSQPPEASRNSGKKFKRQRAKQCKS